MLPKLCLLLHSRFLFDIQTSHIVPLTGRGTWGHWLPVWHLLKKRPDRFSLQFPAFLRRGNEAWRRSSIVERLAETCGASEMAVREELWPALRAISSDKLNGDPDNFDISLAFGLSSGDHLALHGLRANLKTSKLLATKYDEVQIVNASHGVQSDLQRIDDEIIEVAEQTTEDSAQKSLDFF